jgi:hypothetical protein
MLSWGVGWTLGSVAGGLLGNAFGPRAGMVLMGLCGGAGVIVAWTSPLRRIAADPRHSATADLS